MKQLTFRIRGHSAPRLKYSIIIIIIIIFKKSFLTLRQINQKILEATTSTAFFTANISLRSNRRNPQLGRQNCIRFITSNNITD